MHLALHPITHLATPSLLVLFVNPQPSDAYQGKAAADVIKNVFGWENVLVIAGSDSYSAEGASAFEVAAAEEGISVTRSLQVNLNPPYASLTVAVDAIASSTTRVIFMMAQATTAGLILREAFAQGVLGADSGYVW